MLNENSTRSLRSILNTLAILKSTNQHQKVLHHIVNQLFQIYRCQTAAVVIIDPKTEYLHIENDYGLSLTFCKSFRTRLATGAIGKLLWTGHPILISDSASDPLQAAEIALEYAFGSAVCVQIEVDHRTFGYLHVDSTEKGKFTEEDLGMIQGFADIAGLALVKAQLHEENMQLEVIDRETGLEKYVSFIKKLDAEMEHAKELSESFSLVLLDVDNFKDVVHTYGYDASKKLLREMGCLVKSKLRPIDACGRYGFDEFVILLANTNLQEAIVRAKEFSVDIAHTLFTEQKIESAVSIGVSAYPVNGRTTSDLLLMVKEALFEAQRAGRNTVYFYPTIKQAKGELVS
ncbi:MAG TPA: diguanylate cyclase [Bacteroidota bacterium]|nr:diguanylate cyclase [Bacteroidota bacterium]